MILAIDMGNTNTVIGGIDETKTYFIERVTTDQNRTDTEYAVTIKNVLEMHEIHPLPSREPFSLLWSPLNLHHPASCGKDCGRPSALVGPGIKTGINILMDNPKTLGSDLIVDVAAAIHEHPLPLVVIDMGTATTMSVADKQGNYIGGVILPACVYP